MISKKEFIDLINDYMSYRSKIYALNDIIDIPTDSPIIDFGYRMFDKLIELYFNEYGCDWIDAYLYEDCRKYWIEDVEYKLDSLDDLWDLIKPYRK